MKLILPFLLIATCEALPLHIAWNLTDLNVVGWKVYVQGVIVKDTILPDCKIDIPANGLNVVEVKSYNLAGKESRPALIVAIVEGSRNLTDWNQAPNYPNFPLFNAWFLRIKAVLL